MSGIGFQVWGPTDSPDSVGIMSLQLQLSYTVICKPLQRMYSTYAHQLNCNKQQQEHTILMWLISEVGHFTYDEVRKWGQETPPSYCVFNFQSGVGHCSEAFPIAKFSETTTLQNTATVQEAKVLYILFSSCLSFVLRS